MFESKAGILWIAGIGFFALSFVSNAVVPALMYRDLPEQTVEELINSNIRYQFEDMARRYPDSFNEAYGEPPGGDAEHDEWWNEKCAEALEYGHKIYVGEGCWHCHSQFVRPVSNEEQRWGPVAESWEYQNELNRPVMFGTRRVGPDLQPVAGRPGLRRRSLVGDHHHGQDAQRHLRSLPADLGTEAQRRRSCAPSQSVL